MIAVRIGSDGNIAFLSGGDNVLYEADTVTVFNEYNNRGLKLPMTGGPGQRPFLMAGVFLVLFGGLLLGRRRFRE